MPEPRPVGGAQTMQHFRRILVTRGLAHLAGPIDDTPTPDEPGHPEYHRRQRTETAMHRWTNAVPYRYRNATATHPRVIDWADRATRDLRDAGTLLLTGPFGTGKTHNAYGALRRIAEAGPNRFEMIAVTAPDMYGLLRPGSSERGPEAELRRLCDVPLLLLDDLGTEKISEWTEEATYRLLNTRYNESRPLIITSNLPPDGKGKVPDLVDKLGERITSRLVETTTVVALEGPDRRRTGGTA